MAEMGTISHVVPSFDEAVARYREIAGAIIAAKDLDLDEWLYRYCGMTQTPAGAARYLRFQADLLELADVSDPNRVMVDAGCGFGFSMVAHVLLGARRVRGVELNQSMVDSVAAFLPRLPEDVRERIEVTQGSVHSMPYEAASADVVLSLEAISHYLDVDAFIDEALRVLRPGGCLIVADGNNGLNPQVRKKTHEIWQAVESGPGNRTVHGHPIGPCYEEVRRDLLARQFPEIDEAARREIARRSAGFTESELAEAARRHRADGSLPNRPYRSGTLAVAPDGTAMERLFSPPALARRLKQRGFARSRAYGYWGGAGASPLVRTANRILTTLSPVTIFTAPSLRLVARKGGDRR